MATPAQIANDLDIEGALLVGTGYKRQGMSMQRGARAIRDLLRVNAELEAATQVEADRLERCVDGEGR